MNKYKLEKIAYVMTCFKKWIYVHLLTYFTDTPAKNL